MELVCPCPKCKQRVSPFYHPSIHQLSTLEKTKLCHHPNLSSVLITSFQQIACGGALARDWCHGRQRLSPFYHISQLSHSRDSDFHSFSSSKLSDAKDDRIEGALAIRLIISLDFAVTRSSPDSFASFSTSRQNTRRTEMANVEQTQK